MAAKADGQIIIDTEIRTDGAEAGTQQIRRSIIGLKDSLRILPQAFRDIPQIARHAFSSASGAVKKLTPGVRNLQDEIDRYSDALYYAEKAGYGLGDLPYDEAYAGLEKAKNAAESYKKIISSANTPTEKAKMLLGELKKQIFGVSNTQKKATKENKKYNKSLKNTEKSSRGANRGLARMLATSILFSTVFRAISAVTSGLKEGMDNLAQYSEETNQALSLLLSRMTQLKNSFATAFSPVIEYAAPALAKLISLLAEAVTWTSQLFAALTGKDTFVKAVQVQQDYAESLDKTAESTKEVAKETEKALAPFDDLIQLQKSGSKTDTTQKDDSELKPSQMFETAEVSNNAKLLAEDIKKTFSGLFDPIKQSWQENGPTTFESVKNLLSAAKQLASDVGASFMQVWNVEGYGKAITDALVITFSNLVQAAANLVTQFDLAWTSGNVGISIIRHLGDIILEFTGFLRQASEDIKNWSERLDFSPLLKSFDGVLVAIRPIVNDVGNILLWLLNKVLLPLAKWGVEQGLPKAFDLIAAALRVLHEIIKALEPTATWLWEEFLQPIGGWTGEIIIAALEKIVEWLTKFSDWISKNQKTVETFTIIVLAFFAAWKATEFIVGVTAIIAILTKLSGVLAFLGIDLLSIVSKLAMTALKFGALTLAITGIISVIAILARNWNSMSPTEKVISSILAAAAAVGVLAVALGAVKGAAGAAVVAAALVAGVAAAQIAINAGKRNVASYSGGYSGYIRSSGYPISAYSAIPYQPPMLATGTVVPPRAGISYFGIGDNNHEPEVVSPLSTMKQALKEALLEVGMDGERDITVQMVLNDRVFGQAVYKANNQEKQRVGVRMVSQNG